jgi:hypothetical protein
MSLHPIAYRHVYMARSRGWKRPLALVVAVTASAIFLPRAKREIFGDRCSGHGWGRASVRVTATDARTGQPLSKEQQWRSALVVRDGDYVDSSTVAYGAAWERAGTYEVVVRAPGYREWRREGVRVPERLCDFKRARLKARLIPLDP